MLKSELRERLYGGAAIEDCFEFRGGQGCEIFWSHWPKENEDENEIIYVADIPDLDYKQRRSPLEPDVIEMCVLEYVFTAQDFIDECNGNAALAKFIFDYVDWQTPSMAIEGDFKEFTEEEQRYACGCTYDELFGERYLGGKNDIQSAFC